MNKIKTFFLFNYRYWQARIATAFVKACQHEPEVILYDALNGGATFLGREFRVAYCLRCGAMQVITSMQDEEAGNFFRPLQPTWSPYPLANVDLMVRPTPQDEPGKIKMRLPFVLDELAKAFWGTSPSQNATPQVESSEQALKAHQEFLNTIEKTTHASQTLARRPHEHNDELKEPPAR